MKENLAPTKELSIETMERVVKLIQEGNPKKKEVGGDSMPRQ